MISSRSAVVACMAFLLSSIASAGPVTSFADISFWTGTGNRQAALAIDWQGQNEASKSLVWGFRWNDMSTPAPTAAEMFATIVREDPRLFAKVGEVGGLGTAIYGVGFDASGDGILELSDGTVFNDQGLAESGPADFGTPLDEADFYREGWFLGYWHFANSDLPDSEWETAGGISDTALTNERWYSLAFTNDVFDQSSFVSGLVAAEKDILTGDFDRNGTVDAADLNLWSATFGESQLAAGYAADGNRDFAVDYQDFLVWQSNFGNSVSTNIPEPSGQQFIQINFIAFLCFLRRTLRDRDID